MTDEELSKLIAEFLPYPSKNQHYALRSFAKLVAEAEREACAQIAFNSATYIEAAKAIRARGQI